MPITLEKHESQSIIPFQKDIRDLQGLNFAEKVFFTEIRSLIRKSPNQRYYFSFRTLGKWFCVTHQTISNWMEKLMLLELVETGFEYKDQVRKQYIKEK